MMKQIKWCIPALIAFLSCNSNPNPSKDGGPGYTIQGVLKGIDSGSVKLVMYNQDDRSSKTIDSGGISGHSFTLKGRIGSPQMLTLEIQPGNWMFPLFVEDTILSVTADTAGSQYYDYTAYGEGKGASMKNFTESGSKNQDDWMKYQNDPALKQFEPIFGELRKQYDATSNIDEQYKIRDRMDSVRKLQLAKQTDWINKYVSANPESVAGVYMFNELYKYSQDMPVSEMDSMLNKFNGDARSSSYYAFLAKDLAKKKAVQPGSIAPDFALLKRDSSRFTLSFTRGKYIMIDFWASWCHPCRQAIPHWKKVYQQYHDKGFDMVSVSDDSRWSDWTKAMDTEKMPWTQVVDEFPVKNMPAKVGSLYMTTYIPFYVLLDKEGKILVYSGKEEDIDNKLKEIFGS